MFVIVAYDIADTKRRGKLARLLAGFGERVQYSVFECDLEERHYERLLELLAERVEPGDAVRLYRLPGKSVTDVTVFWRPPSGGARTYNRRLDAVNRVETENSPTGD